METRRPLDEKEIVIHIPKGTKHNVRIEEQDAAHLPSEIVVQVSKKRKPGPTPVLGVIVK
jgi:hypothetical protein